MRHIGYAPYGFRWNGDKLDVVESEAGVRRLAFELYLELRNKAAVARRLNELGHQTRRGSKWRDVTVVRILGMLIRARPLRSQEDGPQQRWRAH